MFSDSVVFFSDNAAIGGATIHAAAKGLALRVDEITDQRRLLSTKLVVTVPVMGEQIEAFRDAQEADGWRAAALSTSW